MASALPWTGVLDNFKDANGQFFCNSTGKQEEGDKRLRSMLTLFRASEISFPGEKVMDEAKAFTTEYLNQVLIGAKVTDIDQSLFREVSDKYFFKVSGKNDYVMCCILECTVGIVKSLIRFDYCSLGEICIGVSMAVQCVEMGGKDLYRNMWTKRFMAQVITLLIRFELILNFNH